MYIVSQNGDLIVNSNRVARFRSNYKSIEADYSGNDRIPEILAKYDHFKIADEVFQMLLHALECDVKVFYMPDTDLDVGSA